MVRLEIRFIHPFCISFVSFHNMILSYRRLFFQHPTFVLILLFALPFADSLSFNFSNFPQNDLANIIFSGDAFSSGSRLHLTRDQINTTLNFSVGRAAYKPHIRLWDAKTQKLTDFTSHFSFKIFSPADQAVYGDGLAFFLAPVHSTIPPNSDGGGLGLVNSQSASNSSENQIVAVEFDSFKNDYDPSNNHVGIDVNSVISVATVLWNSSIRDGRTANAWVTYNSTSHNLSVFLTYADNPVFGGNSSLWHIIDLRTVLPETIIIGFSAATGSAVQTHSILSWEFSSSLEVAPERNNRTALTVGIVVPLACISVGLLVVFLLIRRKRRNLEYDEELDVSMDDEFEKGTGPRRFTYADLNRATKNFSDDGKLGEGGFGGVYKGLLSDSGTEIAVKRVSKGSKQGKKEYISEVKIISKLRHRNLVQLIGWCHGQGELLLVYELMPNGSLDTHLFGNKQVLTWELRYKIALGLASALLYLHEEGEQCVVHRDIKSSNIMLDSNFNAKLGDFGLARFVDHNLGSQTTVLAGTMGYMAPECYTTGKASKESDVYSFGVVALEIACGRKPVEMKADPTQVRLLEWVWSLYGECRLVEAADQRLSSSYDERQLEHLMIVGLWCCHPDPSMRPNIRQVINVLNAEAPLPNLPSKLPVPTYVAPVINMTSLMTTSSNQSSYMYYESDQYNTSSTATADTKSTSTTSSSQALLHSV